MAINVPATARGSTGDRARRRVFFDETCMVLVARRPRRRARAAISRRRARWIPPASSGRSHIFHSRVTSGLRCSTKGRATRVRAPSRGARAQDYYGSRRVRLAGVASTSRQARRRRPGARYYHARRNSYAGLVAQLHGRRRALTTAPPSLSAPAILVDVATPRLSSPLGARGRLTPLVVGVPPPASDSRPTLNGTITACDPGQRQRSLGGQRLSSIARDRDRVPVAGGASIRAIRWWSEPHDNEVRCARHGAGRPLCVALPTTTGDRIDVQDLRSARMQSSLLQDVRAAPGAPVGMRSRRGEGATASAGRPRSKVCDDSAYGRKRLRSRPAIRFHPLCSPLLAPNDGLGYLRSRQFPALIKPPTAGGDRSFRYG